MYNIYVRRRVENSVHLYCTYEECIVCESARLYRERASMSVNAHM